MDEENGTGSQSLVPSSLSCDLWADRSCSFLTPRSSRALRYPSQGETRLQDWEKHSVPRVTAVSESVLNMEWVTSNLKQSCTRSD